MCALFYFLFNKYTLNTGKEERDLAVGTHLLFGEYSGEKRAVFGKRRGSH